MGPEPRAALVLGPRPCPGTDSSHLHNVLPAVIAEVGRAHHIHPAPVLGHQLSHRARQFGSFSPPLQLHLQKQVESVHIGCRDTRPCLGTRSHWALGAARAPTGAAVYCGAQSAWGHVRRGASLWAPRHCCVQSHVLAHPARDGQTLPRSAQDSPEAPSSPPAGTAPALLTPPVLKSPLPTPRGSQGPSPRTWGLPTPAAQH